MARDDLTVRRSMADVLTRLFRRLTVDALPFYNQLKADEDPDVLAAVSNTSADLRFLDIDLWAENLLELSKHELPVVRRNIVPSLRDYFETFPDDSRKLLPLLWQDGDEVVRTRMRELLVKMCDISPPKFAARLTDLSAENCDLDPLWQLMDARRENSSEVWINWLSGTGEIPQMEVKPQHVSTKQAPDKLPSLDDALDTLDQELGFLD